MTTLEEDQLPEFNVRGKTYGILPARGRYPFRLTALFRTGSRLKHGQHGQRAAQVLCWQD